MRINTLSGRNRASNETPRPGTGESLEAVETALRSAIANRQVSEQNVKASDSHSADTAMSAEMRTYTESQIRLLPRSATHAPADAAPRTILDLLQ